MRSIIRPASWEDVHDRYPTTPAHAPNHCRAHQALPTALAISQQIFHTPSARYPTTSHPVGQSTDLVSPDEQGQWPVWFRQAADEAVAPEDRGQWIHDRVWACQLPNTRLARVAGGAGRRLMAPVIAATISS